jgi:predicted dehydrogenase
MRPFRFTLHSGTTSVQFNRDASSGADRARALRGIDFENNGDGDLVKKPAVAVVGLGYWGPNLVRVLLERPGVDVRWLCENDPARLEHVGRRYPGARLTTELDEVLDDRAVDGVLLATPVFTHYELGRRCLEAGKHSFVEKPLASSGPEAVELIKLASDRDLVLMCGHTFLYSPPVRMIRELIEADKLGDLFFISSSRVNLGPPSQRAVSVIWDLGPHDFSILRYWLGQCPQSIRAVGRDLIVPGFTDVAFVTMEFGSGLVANVELSWLAPSKLRRTVIVGSNRMVLYEDGSHEAVKLYDSGIELKDPETFGEWHLSYRTGDVIAPKIANDEPLSLQIEDFLSAIGTGERRDGHLPLALDVVRLTEAAEASVKREGTSVALAEFEPVTEGAQ